MDLQNALASLGGYNALLATLEQSLIGVNLCMRAPATPEEQTELERSISLFETLYSALQELHQLRSPMNRQAFKDLLSRATIGKDARLLLGIHEIAPTEPEKEQFWGKLRPTHEIFEQCIRHVPVPPDRLEHARTILRELVRSVDQRTAQLKTQCELALRSGQPGTLPGRPF